MVELTRKQEFIATRINKAAEVYGFKRMKRLPKDKEVIYLAKWKKGGYEVFMYKQNIEDRDPWIFFDENGDASGNDHWSIWVHNIQWEYFLNPNM